MKAIIKVENMSKQYRLGASRESYPTLRDALAGAFRAPLRRRRGGRAGNETIWALKDVGFEIALGEVVGIIGRNGAGKSTLLKILSRITEPTSGRAELYGRTASLLEVGTGFHPELTGRENMFLNAAILGMPRSEIERKFDEIVAFAQCDRALIRTAETDRGIDQGLQDRIEIKSRAADHLQNVAVAVCCCSASRRWRKR